MIEQHRIKFSEVRPVLAELVDEDEPSQQGSLRSRTRLVLAGTEATDDLRDNLGRDPVNRIEIFDQGSDCPLIKEIFSCQNVDQSLKCRWGDAAFISVRSDCFGQLTSISVSLLRRHISNCNQKLAEEFTEVD